MGLEAQSFEQKNLFILFGPPGCGKNYVGDIMAERYGFLFYDADVDHTDEQNQAKQEGRPFTEEMRVGFFEKVHTKIEDFLHSNNRLVVANAFINDRFRGEFLAKFPLANFILLEVSHEERKRRILARESHGVPPELAIIMGDRFEPVTIPHKILNNEGGLEKLIPQLDDLVNPTP